MSPTDPPALGIELVRALARLEGYPPLDAETAARIAAGATSAVRAVAAAATASLFDVEPASFLAELERLGDAG
jgi:hypothetical protein